MKVIKLNKGERLQVCGEGKVYAVLENVNGEIYNVNSISRGESKPQLTLLSADKSVNGKTTTKGCGKMVSAFHSDDSYRCGGNDKHGNKKYCPSCKSQPKETK